jgi:hypothetical protein
LTEVTSSLFLICTYLYCVNKAQTCTQVAHKHCSSHIKERTCKLVSFLGSCELVTVSVAIKKYHIPEYVSHVPMCQEYLLSKVPWKQAYKCDIIMLTHVAQHTLACAMAVESPGRTWNHSDSSRKSGRELASTTSAGIQPKEKAADR